ncbi:hypothetical protein HMSSN036_65500 [Paenibacillus macerans]|nr:hypothetical protein HMSSN036_65500 [Paenibacillus macerans]
MKSFARETGSSAIAIQCWSSLQDAMGIMPCLANAILTDEQIPVTCETDIHGAITSVMVQAAAMNTAPPSLPTSRYAIPRTKTASCCSTAATSRYRCPWRTNRN